MESHFLFSSHLVHQYYLASFQFCKSNLYGESNQKCYILLVDRLDEAGWVDLQNCKIQLLRLIGFF